MSEETVYEKFSCQNCHSIWEGMVYWDSEDEAIDSACQLLLQCRLCLDIPEYGGD